MPRGESQNPKHLIRRDPLENLAGNLLGGEVVGVIDDALHHDAGSLHAPRAGTFAGDAFDIGAVGPIDLIGVEGKGGEPHLNFLGWSPRAGHGLVLDARRQDECNSTV